MSLAWDFGPFGLVSEFCISVINFIIKWGKLGKWAENSVRVRVKVEEDNEGRAVGIPRLSQMFINALSLASCCLVCMFSSLEF